MRRNFLCGLQGREPSHLQDLNSELRRWVSEVANQRVHGTTHEQVLLRWDGDQFAMQSCQGRAPYPFAGDESRKVARDAYISWQASRYSVPWIHAGKEVSVRDQADQVEIRSGGERIAIHARATTQHQVITIREHHQGIPLGNPSSGKTLIHIQHGARIVENRPLAAYEAVAMGGVR